MKIAAVLMAAGMGMLACGQGELDTRSSTVTVCVPDTADYPGVNLYWAKTIASRMFVQAGVHIMWQAAQDESSKVHPLFVITFTSSTPEKFPPSMFAYALVYERVHIRIFVDHVVARAHRSTSLGTALLAHVMVHEITHMLEGVNDHSREGIMKATWTQADINGMIVNPLSFTPEDIRLIHAGLAVPGTAKKAISDRSRQELAVVFHKP